MDSILDFMFGFLRNDCCGFLGFGSVFGGDFEAEIARVGGEEAFFYGFGGFEGEDVDAVYYVVD